MKWIGVAIAFPAVWTWLILVSVSAYGWLKEGAWTTYTVAQGLNWISPSGQWELVIFEWKGIGSIYYWWLDSSLLITLIAITVLGGIVMEMDR